MFSSSFVSSAASGVETSTIVSIAAPVDAPRRASCKPASIPPTTFGVVLVVQSLAAGIDALGRRTRDGSLRRPSCPMPASRIGCSTSRVVARPRRRLEHDELALAQHRRDAARRGLDDREIRLALAGERRRQRDQDRVARPADVAVSRSSRGSDPASTSGPSARVLDVPRCGSPGSAPSTTGSTTSTRQDLASRPRQRSWRAASRRNRRRRSRRHSS